MSSGDDQRRHSQSRDGLELILQESRAEERATELTGVPHAACGVDAVHPLRDVWVREHRFRVVPLALLAAQREKLEIAVASSLALAVERIATHARVCLGTQLREALDAQAALQREVPDAGHEDQMRHVLG